MRVAIVSDIHGNLTAFEAVLADLREMSPDLVLHGGDLADNGSSPVEIVDRIHDLGWRGVIGNTDEMLAAPEIFEDFARRLPQLNAIWTATREMAAVSREALGEERLAWLRSLPKREDAGPVALLHASPEDRWRSPAAEATDAELSSAYAAIDRPIVVYGHIHRSFVRQISPECVVINSGSVSLSHDGDPRASYLLLDDSKPIIRRVEYDVEKEINALSARAFPHADWLARSLRAASPQMP
jgi:predicted phosphodiesterase